MLLATLLAGGSAWAWPPGIPSGPRVRDVEIPAQDVVRYSSATANGFAIQVKDLSRLDSDLSEDEVTSFEATSGPLRFTNFHVTKISPMFEPANFGGGVLTNAQVGKITLAGMDSLPARFVDLAAFGTVDVEQGGKTIARDRSCVVEIGHGQASLVLTGLGWDGQEQDVPGKPHGYLTVTWDGVTLGDPSSPPDRLVEIGADKVARSIGGLVEVRAIDQTDRATSPTPDAVQHIILALHRADGSSLVVQRLALDPDEHGGVLLDGVVDGLGKVSMAVWGKADVADSAGKLVAHDVPLSIFAMPDGDVHVQLQGMIDVLARGGVVK